MRPAHLIRRTPLLAATALLLTGLARADDWPQWLGPQRDGVWRETGLVEKFPAGGPKIKWRAPIGSGYAGPAVADGKVYVADRILDEGAKLPGSGFTKNVQNGKERILCLDEATGKVLWKHEYPCKYEIQYPSGPRCTPVVAGGKVWTVGAMGDVFCLDAAKGTVIWQKNFVNDFNASVPVWGFAGSPLLDGDRLICLAGGKDAIAIALHKDTGKVVWKSLSASEPGYSPPMIYTFAGVRQLIIWHADAVNGLKPDTGEPIWSQPFKVKAGLTAPTPKQDGNKLFVTSFYNGSMMLEFGNKPEPTVKWKGKSNSEQADKTDGLHSIIPTPFIVDGYIYGVCSYGQLRCLKADTGERVWMDLKATGSTQGGKDRWNNAFLIQQGTSDRFFLFTEKGDVIIARLTPKGYEEISRANVLKPDNMMAGRPVIWSHPAFANKNMYARNDGEIICVSLAGQ